MSPSDDFPPRCEPHPVHPDIRQPPLSIPASQLLNYLVGTDDNFTTGPVSHSIYQRLCPLFSAPDDGLDPAPPINAALGDLVSCLQGVPPPGVMFDPSSFADIEEEICHFIDNSEALTRRASEIRSLACRAEGRLELFFVKRLLVLQPEVDEQMSLVQRIVHASAEFPYTANYMSMVKKEAEVINSIVDTSSKHVKHLSHPNNRMTIVFGGSGPLPLTGIFLAVYMDVSVILIDNDSQAVRLSTQLIERWESSGVIPKGRISVLHKDVADVNFQKAQTSDDDDNVVVCDVVFLAALIDNHTKQSIAERAGDNDNAPLFVLRTAHGLTARFAYFQTTRRIFCEHLKFISLVVPSSHAKANGYAVDESMRPKDWFCSEILNSLELYRN